MQILYSLEGHGGGGKTDTAIHWLAEPVDIAEYRGLIIRRNATDLADFIDRAYLIWRYWGVRKTGNPATFKFPSGAVIYSGHLADKDSYTKYMGWELQRVLIEELTHIPSKELFDKLMGSLRSTIDGLPAQFMGNTNPGGAGNEWVKGYWHITDPEYTSGEEFFEDGVYKIYVPANIDSNPHLSLKDPKYVQWLKNLPLDLRKKWYEGSWDDIDTKEQYYAAALTRSRKAGRMLRIPVESSLRTFAAFDLGMNDQMVIWIWQMMGMERRIVGCYAGRNLPIKPYSDALKKFEQNNELNIETVFLPHDSKVRSMTSDSAMTRFEKFEGLGWKCELVPNVSLDDGIEQTRELLTHCFFNDTDKEYEEVDGITFSMLAGLRALRAYKKEFDEKMNRYKNKPLHDWASDYSDAFRYLALGNGTIRTTSTNTFTNQGSSDWA